MRYDFSKMDADSFEQMVRSLNEGIFGIKCKQYGLGADGQREFVFEGDITDKAGNHYEGRTIGQVKYKYLTTNKDDFKWLTDEIDGEMAGFQKKEKSYRPKNYLFFTNIVLTPMKENGLKDKIDHYIEKYKNLVPNIQIMGYDEICTMLDNNRDVATTYASHMLSGDILAALAKQLQKEEDYTDCLKIYLSRKFSEEMYTRMDQAGSVTEDRIRIEKVCIDIDAYEKETEEQFAFAERIFRLGNSVRGYKKDTDVLGNPCMERCLEKSENFVLIGGPGQGKSTICQFVAQIYRACYLRSIGYKEQRVTDFWEEVQREYGYPVDCARIPFKIVLKDYAAWMKRQGEYADTSVLKYMQEQILLLTGETLKIPVIRNMLRQLAWIFLFDGLDEVPESSNRASVLKNIQTFLTLELSEAECDCMVVATTREQGYNNDFDEEKYTHLTVAELSQEMCMRYIDRLFTLIESQTERRNECLEIVREAITDDRIARLMKTPLQATIISILVKSGGKPPHERYALFKEYYETMVRREKQKGVIATLNDHTEWVNELHYLVAQRLQRESEYEDNPSAEISKQDFACLVGAYVEENIDGESDEVDMEKMTDDFIRIITNRLCFLCENREGVYSFTIRTMQEFFAGTYLVKDCSDDDAIKNIEEIAYHSYWRNTLLFALGYIELERKSMDDKIANLCEQMNGRDNLCREDYTSENLVLFGSKLAIDILAENLFRGKRQNKYVKIAAQLIETENALSEAYRSVSGTEALKLVKYLDEYYTGEGYLEKQMTINAVLLEKTQDKVAEYLKKHLDLLPEKKRMHWIEMILESKIADALTYKKELESDLIEYIKDGKMDHFLSYALLTEIVKQNPCREVYAFAVMQGLYGSYNGRMSANILKMCMEKQFEQRELIAVIRSMNPYKRDAEELQVRITENFSYRMNKTFPEEKELLKKAIREFKLLDAEYAVRYAEFLVEPVYENYFAARECQKSQPEYIRTECEKIWGLLWKPLPESEEQFEDVMRKHQEAEQQIRQNEPAEFLKQEMQMGLSYSACCFPMVYDELLEKGPIPVSKMECLGTNFFKSYLFAAYVQLNSTGEYSGFGEETIQNYLLTVKEMKRRNIDYMYKPEMLMILWLSQAKEEAFETVLDFKEEEVIQYWNGIQKHDSVFPWLTEEIREKIVAIIVEHVLKHEEEDHYYMLIPFVLTKGCRLKNSISKVQLERLRERKWELEQNQLTELLLEICLSDSDEWREKTEELFAVIKSVKQKGMAYDACFRMIWCAALERKETLFVQLYLQLQSEKFDGAERIRKKILKELEQIKQFR